MTILIRILQLILSLSLLVMIHELGHYTFARIFGVRVSKFYMFFNPQISIVRMKKINGRWQVRFFAPNVPDAAVEKTDANGKPVLDKKGNPEMRPMTDAERAALPEDDWRRYPETTEWGIGWIPLGGYCAIEGMVDETTDADKLSAEPQPWEYRAKSTWQRLPIICGGVLVNFIGAFIIYSCILGYWGTDVIPLESARYGMHYSEEMLHQGFRQGDRIIRVGDRTPDTRADLLNWMVIEGQHDITLVRENKLTQRVDTVQLQLSDDFDQHVLAAGGSSFIDFRFPFVIAEVTPNGAADKAGLLPGDSLVSVDSVPTPCFQDVSQELSKFACDSVRLQFVRNGEPCEATLFLGDEAKMACAVVGADAYLQSRHTDYSFFEAIPAGIRFGWETLGNYVKQFRLVFTPEGAKSLGGFATIGSLFPEQWNWHAFWLMTAFLSIILGFMNIIPIPGLDGGHMLFLIWEMITGKKPSDKFLETANNIGFYFLLALLIYANGNDIYKWLQHLFG